MEISRRQGGVAITQHILLLLLRSPGGFAGTSRYATTSRRWRGGDTSLAADYGDVRFLVERMNVTYRALRSRVGSYRTRHAVQLRTHPVSTVRGRAQVD